METELEVKNLAPPVKKLRKDKNAEEDHHYLKRLIIVV